MAIKTSNQITFTEQKKIVEIKEWYLATSQSEGVTIDTEGWTTTIQIIDDTNKYLWNYEEVVYSLGPSDVSDPLIVGYYGKGEDGKSIASITNYYQITTDTTIPTEWLTTVQMLDPENKYLWNYEEIVYTTGDSTKTEPAIIGVYGDSGADMVDFQIYSVDGFEFTEDLDTIELKTVAFKGGAKLNEDDISYQWKWWNDNLELDDKYEDISGATGATLTVNVYDEYAYSSIKCEITYDGIAYEDYVSLTEKTIVYTAVAKFFDGSNVITTDKEYLLVYIELYKDNTAEELLQANTVYLSDNNIVQDSIVTTDIDGEFTDGDMMYFACKNTYDDVTEYDIILAQYTLEQWQIVSNDYIYKNDLFAYTTSPVLLVPKEKISRSLNINFVVYHNGGVIARTNATVLDLNDPTVSAAEPSDPQQGQLWLDTSVSPSILKMWDGTAWVNSGYQNGNIVYTSQPQNGYTKGDLWILADGETCGDFGPGSMLKATTTSSTFSESHWEDAMEENTAVINNIRQYFLFNADTGLRIGQSDENFYVNISSTEMGFYDASSGSAQKVVSISNQSATIKNLTVEDGATFNCEVRFGDFVWKTESNGSLSLALST